MRSLYLLYFFISFAIPAQAGTDADISPFRTSTSIEKINKNPKPSTDLHAKRWALLLVTLILTLSGVKYYYTEDQEKQLEDELDEVYRKAPLLLDDTIPNFQPTKKSQNTYHMDHPCETFYADIKNKKDHAIGLDHTSHEGYLSLNSSDLDHPEVCKQKQSYKFFQTIDKDYTIYDVAGDGNCFIYSWIVCIIHQLSFSEKRYQEFVSNVKFFRQEAIYSYEKLLNSDTALYRSYLRQEPSLRIKEAHERFLKAVPYILALLKRIKDEKSFKQRIDILNHTPRWVIVDFFRAGNIVAKFTITIDSAQKKNLTRKDVGNLESHFLDSTAWYTTNAHIFDPLCEHMDLYFCPIYCFGDLEQGMLWENGMKLRAHTTEDQALITHQKKCIIVHKGNHFRLAIDPDLCVSKKAAAKNKTSQKI